MFRNALLALVSAGLIGCSLHFSGRTWTSPNLKLQAVERNGTIGGEWRASVDALEISPLTSITWVTLEIGNQGNRVNLGRPLGAFEGLQEGLRAGAQSVRFRLSEEVGGIAFEGNREGSNYLGTFDFSPSPEFKRDAKAFIWTEPTTWELLEFCVSGIDRRYLEALTDNGAQRLRAEEVLTLKQSGITADYFQSMRAAGIGAIPDIIMLRNSGVTAELVNSFRRAGYNFSPREIVRLRNSGVNPDYAAGWRAADFDFSADQLVRLRDSGVSSDYGRRLHASGLNVTLDELIRLRNSGISSDYVQDLLVGAKFTPAEIVRLRNAGVSSDYVAAWGKAGYVFTVEELVRLRNAGVPSSYGEALIVPGRRPPSAETLIDLHNRGISSDRARRLRE